MCDSENMSYVQKALRDAVIKDIENTKKIMSLRAETENKSIVSETFKKSFMGEYNNEQQRFSF